jgi:Raf kinase inhibitor-like YbhB/YbcL family protein
MKTTGIMALLLVLALGIGTVLMSSNMPGGTAQQSLETAQKTMTPTGIPFALSSSAFKSGASIPSTYTCDEQQVSPPLTISGAPAGTKSYVLIVEDPDVPKKIKPDGVFLHWVVFNIPGYTTDIVEGHAIGVAGANGTGKPGYVGPCPPKEYQPTEHRYIFTLYALDTELSLPAGASKAAVMKAMQGHMLAQTDLIGLYQKK